MGGNSNFFSLDKIVGAVIFILFIAASVFIYYNFSNNKTKAKESNSKILIIIDSSKTMENYYQKINKEINNITKSPLNLLSQYYLMTLSRKDLTDNWSKSINTENLSINFFGPSQISSIIELSSTDKFKEANKIILITCKNNNDNQLTISKELEDKIKSIDKLTVIQLEE
jgi:hypothetical protein